MRSLELSLTALLTLGPIFSNHFNRAEQHRQGWLQRAAAEIVADTCLRQFLNTRTNRSSRDTGRQELKRCGNGLMMGDRLRQQKSHRRTGGRDRKDAGKVRIVCVWQIAG